MTDRTEIPPAPLLDVPVPDLDRDRLPMLWHWPSLLDRVSTGVLRGTG
jgi:hypothetical protein